MSLPVSVWRPDEGNTEYSNEGANDIVDTLDNNLVDTLDNQIVDTGVIETPIPATEWVMDEGE